MNKYRVLHTTENGENQEWEIESTNYLQAHLDVLAQEGYHIELTNDEKLNISKKQNVST